MSGTGAAHRQPLRQLPKQVPRLATIGVVIAVLALAAGADRSRPTPPGLAAVTGMPGIGRAHV